MELSKKDIVEIQKRLAWVRAHMLKDYPFYGKLLLTIPIGLMACQTACTDMKKIFFDPVFMGRISDEELEFVLNHEVLHCVLGHPARRKGRNPKLWNLASDLVVNSTILSQTGRTEFKVDGVEVMHKVPDGREAHLFHTERVYKMLTKDYEENGTTALVIDCLLDEHLDWDEVSVSDGEAAALQAIWEKQAERAGAGCSAEDVPPQVREIIRGRKKTKVDWQAALHSFVEICTGDLDYTFQPPDRRFTDSEFIFPAFNEGDEECIENIWFCVDASGSVSNEMLGIVMEEIRLACEQMKHMSGTISTFDTKVNETLEFERAEDLKLDRVMGGGGTNFGCIFEHLQENMENNPPRAIIILTDGYAVFPKEEEAGGIPVLWIVLDSDVTPPWGTTIKIKS